MAHECPRRTQLCEVSWQSIPHSWSGDTECSVSELLSIELFVGSSECLLVALQNGPTADGYDGRVRWTISYIFFFLSVIHSFNSRSVAHRLMKDRKTDEHIEGANITANYLP